MSPRLTVVEHIDTCPVDRLGDWLWDVDVRVVRPYAGELVPSRPGDGLIVLGGPMNAYDDTATPWLPAVRELLASAVRESTPTLGICLGAQLLAVAAGGRVEVGAAPGVELGVIDVRWRPEAAADPLVSGLPDPFPAASAHGDAVAELPARAVWLAESARYPHQAFRVGTSAWGVQFHPEASEATFRGWAHDTVGVDVDVAMVDFRRRDADSIVGCERLIRRFAGLFTPATAVTVPHKP
jgi:GMP synthase (glutamine-hydrolysing)